MAWTYEGLQATYASLLKRMLVEPTYTSKIENAAKRIIANRARYERVQAAIGVPWAFVGVLHYRESSNDFAGVLHNGERIIGKGVKTSLVPAGRGPFASWQDAAIDALKIKGLQAIKSWPLERICYEGERFNGFGYRNKGKMSPYLWSGSNLYAGGKYVQDGVYDSTEWDKQLGIIPIYLRVSDLTAPVTPTTVKVDQLAKLRTVMLWLKTIVTSIVGWFTLENAGLVKEWASLKEYVNLSTLLAAAGGGFLAWLAMKWFEVKATAENLEKDKTDADGN